MEVSPTAIPVTESSQAGHARRTAAALAERLGFNEEEQGKVALVVSEAAKNLVAHAREGQILLRPLHAGARLGVELLALDKGPGMADVDRCMRDGYTTTGTGGSGLGAMRRQSALFDIHSVPGVGTAVLARLWAGKSPPPPEEVTVGVVCLPKPGEEVSGDAWAVDHKEGRTLFLVADGLGHGPEAARASRAAVVSFLEQGSHELVELLRGMDQEVRSTRGAAVALAALSGGQLHYAGVGNISAAVVSPAGAQRLVSMNGTLGHQAPRKQQFSYAWSEGATLVMCSDGLSTQWKLEGHPGLLARHPSLVAGVLYRDFVRGRDDVTVLVAREGTGRGAR